LSIASDFASNVQGAKRLLAPLAYDCSLTARPAKYDGTGIISTAVFFTFRSTSALDHPRRRHPHRPHIRRVLICPRRRHPDRHRTRRDLLEIIDAGGILIIIFVAS